MELRVTRKNIFIVPDNEADIAFLEDTIGLTEDGAMTFGIRVDKPVSFNDYVGTIKILNTEEVMERQRKNSEEKRTQACPQCFEEIDMIEDEFMVSHIVPGREFFVHPTCYKNFKKKLERMAQKALEDAELEE